jgi:hypothetical protein
VKDRKPRIQPRAEFEELQGWPSRPARYSLQISVFDLGLTLFPQFQFHERFREAMKRRILVNAALSISSFAR